MVVETKTAAGDDAMQVGMEVELPCPGVQDGRDPEEPAEATGIAPHGEQSLRGGAEQQGEDQAAIVQREPTQSTRKCEYDMEVVGWQDALGALLDPVGLGQALTLGTVAVPARIICRALIAAGVADVEVATEDAGATRFDRPHGGVLLFAEPVPATVSVTVGSEDVADVWRVRRSGTGSGD